MKKPCSACFQIGNNTVILFGQTYPLKKGVGEKDMLSDC
jgi:hypothetical protein